MHGAESEKKTKSVEAVDKALNILSLFSAATPALTLTEVSKRSGYVKSTAMRLLLSLQQARLVTITQDKQYRVGSEAFRLGTLYQNNLKMEATIRPVLRDLVNRTGESASFFRREGNMRVCLFREDSAQILREHVAEGEAVSLDKGAAGHVLVLFAYVDGTVAATPEQRASIPQISTGERGADITGMAVPVFAAKLGLVGSLTLSGPSTRFTAEKIAVYREDILAAATHLSRELGARFYE